MTAATYVKFMMSSYEFASRNRREVSVVSELGHDVFVCDVSSTSGVERDGDVLVHHRRRKLRRPLVVRRVLILVDFLYRLPRDLRRFRADCLSCHDLIALTIGWISTLGVSRSVRPRLVYDSHEFELGRTTTKPRSRITKAVLKRWEGFLIRRCAFTISVNESIADLLTEVHRLRTRPIVVRSTPPRWSLDDVAIRRTREEVCGALGLPTSTFLAMYHGGVVPGRGIETFLRALAGVPGIAGVVLGSGGSTYTDQLRALAIDLGVDNRVLFRPAVPVDELPHHVAAADVGMVLIQAVSDSYFLSLPNKLFENIQALTPVIASEYPEIRAIVEGYSVGLTVDPDDVPGVTAALRQVSVDQELRRRWDEGLARAKQELCWERERAVLRRSYEDLLGTGRPHA